MTVSPTGPSFRRQCRLRPSVVTACTVDWYGEWPEDALLAVADSFLREKVDLGSREVSTASFKDLTRGKFQAVNGVRQNYVRDGSES